MGEKKVKGRKRHIATDTLSNLLAVVVHAANVPDTIAGVSICQSVHDTYPSVEAFSADQAYRGTTLEYVENILGLRMDITPKPDGKGFQVIPKRWAVERTFAWLGNFRRLSKDYEILTSTAENMVRIAMIKITLAKCL
jgi:putative transposase